MVITHNCPNDEQLHRFIKFCESKIEFKYPVRMYFKNTWRGASAGKYHERGKYIDIKLKAYTRHDLFKTVAHELRHAHQDMYQTPEWVGSSKNCETDAVTWGRQIVAEFGETEEDLDLSNSNCLNKKSWLDF